MCRYYVLKFTLYYDDISGDKRYIQKLRKEDKHVKDGLLNQMMIRYTTRQETQYEVLHFRI